MSWIVYALLSALLSGTSWILAKGAKGIVPTLSTALRSLVLLGGAAIAIICSGGYQNLGQVSRGGAFCVVLSGCATGLAWLFYLRSLSGGLGRASALDKGSILLTTLGGWLLFGERMNLQRAIALLLICIGILLMLWYSSTRIDKCSDLSEQHRTDSRKSKNRPKWIVWGLLAVLFTGVSSLLAKAGVNTIQSDLALFLRTGVIVILTFGIAIGDGSVGEVGNIERKPYAYLILSGAAASLAWICYFRALREGEAGAVHSLDKLSVLVTALGGRLFFGERLSKIELGGLATLTAGILLLI